MDHQERSDELEEQADDLEERSEELKDEIQDSMKDWESKEGDESVPGAQPPEDEREHSSGRGEPSSGGDERDGSA